MTLTALIDVAVGLIFTYLLLGLIASALQETVAAVMQWRGKALRDGLRALLHDPQGSLFARVFGHALVRPPETRLPSYVPSRNFAMALTDALLDGTNAPLFSQIEGSVASMPESPVKQALTSLLRQAGGDYEAFKKQVEQWFDNAMDRVSGVYKRRAHIFALSFGFVVAVVFNVDSIDISRMLWLDPVKRAQIVDQAQKYVDDAKASGAAATATSGSVPRAGEAPPPAGTATPVANAREGAANATQTLESLPIPLGWPTVRDRTDSWWGAAFIHALVAPSLAGFWKLAGLLATALAVSLGAPFWFDFLQKFLNIRASGPVPSKSTS